MLRRNHQTIKAITSFLFVGAVSMAAVFSLSPLCRAQQGGAAHLQPPPPPTANRPFSVWTQRQGTVTGGASVTGWIQTQKLLIDSDSRRAYILLSPGGRSYYPRRRILRPDGSPQIVPLDKSGAPSASAAGLLVVLPPGDGNGEQAVSFWTEVMRNVLKGRYYIALALPPRWEGLQNVTWLTENNVRQVKDAKFSTETLLADIVRDVSTTYNIDPQRVYLHGAAESGLAAYACSLSETTPFRGFYIHDAAFRSAQLPALSHAKGRRYFLQQSEDDKTQPLWMADAARKMLSDRGANVKLTTYRGQGAYNFPENTRWDRMTEAITWLEAGSQTAAKAK